MAANTRAHRIKQNEHISSQNSAYTIDPEEAHILARQNARIMMHSLQGDVERVGEIMDLTPEQVRDLLVKRDVPPPTPPTSNTQARTRSRGGRRGRSRQGQAQTPSP